MPYNSHKTSTSKHPFSMTFSFSRIILTFLSMAFLSLPLLALSQEKESTGSLEPVTLQLKWKPQFQFAGYYAALELGFYEEEGLDVTIRPLTSDVDVIKQVASGEVEYAIGGSGILAYYANGSPIKAISAIFQHDPLVFIAKQSSGIISPYEMADKRIMFDGLTGDDAPLRAILADAGLTQPDYTLADKTFNNQALINDEIDVMSAYITNQPFQLQKEGIPINIINPQNYGFDFYGDILYTSEHELTEHSGRAARFKRASLKGWKYALDHPDELIQLLKNKYGSTSTLEGLQYEARETRKLILPDIIPLGTIEYERLRRVAGTYSKLDLAKPLSEEQLQNFVANTASPIKLSESEVEWLKVNPVVRVGIDPAYAPYEWVNEEGQYVGIAADYIHLLEKRLGVQFEIVQDRPWHELIDMAKAGELDMFACMNFTPERDEFLDFTPAYVINPMVIVNATRNGYIGDIEKLKGKTVAVEDGYFTHDNLKRNHPDINLLIVENTTQALTKVSTGEADAFIGDAAYANYTIKKANLLNLQFAGEAPGSSSYRFGIVQSKPELLSIISKGLNSIEPSERALIEARWMGISVETGIQKEVIIKAGGILFILFLLFLYRHHRLVQSKQALQLVKDELELYGRVFAEANEGIVITDVNNIIVDVNPNFCDITGYSRDEVIGKNPSILSSGKQSAAFYQQMWQRLLDEGRWKGEVWNRKKNGEVYAELLTMSVIKDDKGVVKHYVGLFNDITQNKQQQKSLELMAHYDVLTQLPNRALFIDRFGQAIAHSKRNKKLLAVCFLDLDNFKPVNDTYGHEVGDRLLIEVSERIKATIRDEDTVSRQGGDEFALLLNDIDSFSHVEEILGRLHHALAQPYLIDNVTINIGASSGVTLYPLDEGDIDTLVRHADQAMYQSKLAGKNRFHLFNADKDLQVIEENTKLQEIQEALEKLELCLYYQPKVNMRTGKVYGAEALIRWIHPEKGLIPPLEFLPIIEGTNLEIEVGDWVAYEAIKQVSEWQKQGLNLEVSINISSKYLQAPTFFSKLDSVLAEFPEVPSSKVQLEILESSALGDLKAVSGIIRACRDVLGVSIALDDFGTGYSSLTHLRNLPANTIKIDQSFVRDILDDPSDYRIVDGIIGLSSSFNRSVIAEGVETTAHGLVLLLMGCHHAQGYGISRPIPADDFFEWVDDYVPNSKWMSCGAGDLTAKEQQVELLGVLLDYWWMHIEQSIRQAYTTTDKVTLVDYNKSHCRAWLEKARQELVFNASWVNALEMEAEGMHQLAISKLSQAQVNEAQDIESDLRELQASNARVVTVLEQYK